MESFLFLTLSSEQCSNYNQCWLQGSCIQDFLQYCHRSYIGRFHFYRIPNIFLHLCCPWISHIVSQIPASFYSILHIFLTRNQVVYNSDIVNQGFQISHGCLAQLFCYLCVDRFFRKKIYGWLNLSNSQIHKKKPIGPSIITILPPMRSKDPFI